MMTVRFDNGFSIQYNNATFAKRNSQYTDLYTKEHGAWIAQVPNSAIVESVSPCRTYNPVRNDSDKVQASIDALAKEIRSLKRKLAAK
jgi:hypothetical protein